jgi:hypothetical protein
VHERNGFASLNARRLHHTHTHTRTYTHLPTHPHITPTHIDTHHTDTRTHAPPLVERLQECVEDLTVRRRFLEGGAVGENGLCVVCVCVLYKCVCLVLGWGVCVFVGAVGDLCRWLVAILPHHYSKGRPNGHESPNPPIPPSTQPNNHSANQPHHHLRVSEAGAKGEELGRWSVRRHRHLHRLRRVVNLFSECVCGGNCRWEHRCPQEENSRTPPPRPFFQPPLPRTTPPLPPPPKKHTH